VKTFYSLEDIETLVAQGVRELIVDEDAVLTAVAQEAAARLGLKLLPKGHGPAASVEPLPVAAAPAARPGDAVRAGVARPRGCQHGPLAARDQAGTAPAPRATQAAASSGHLVDDLVGAVKQMASKGSAG
jgi:hypothetical protein